MSIDVYRYDGLAVTAETVREVVALYAATYQEAPYSETESDFVEFAQGLPGRLRQPDARLVVARSDGVSVGFALGHALTRGTLWWSGLISRLPESLVEEWAGRTFAVIELVVEISSRRKGLATKLHEQLLKGVPTARVTLLVRPDANPAQCAYNKFGYRVVGQLQPFDGGPVYNAMLRDLGLGSSGELKRR